MPPAKKRKAEPEGKTEITQQENDVAESTTEQTVTDSKEEPSATEAAPATTSSTSPIPSASENTQPETRTAAQSSATSSTSTSAADSAAAKARERAERFRALQARAKSSSQQNLKEATKESQRLQSDPSQLTALGRRHAIASHKLLKADIEDAGGDFERKRAWDWTVEESERWDKRMKKKEAHRDDTAFRDYNQQAEKSYKRQLRNMGGPDLEKYTREKLAAVEKAAAAGTLEIVETEDGEMIAIDKDGTFFSTADSTQFAQHKPDKAAVDRLVADMRKAEEASLKKRRERMADNGDDADVTYINEKNKQFNQKLGRFYNKYTAEIRDSFERGTMV
ncbi:SYF2 splicing factor-domain-containing protein [Pseudoneurospora amorphoporcata]|uniref:Pre-mRNA-splicing factor SYF2 n=1 Tax=Pseudoneurospora amorphoporcata TaxID=241081 RepID=A0AAN6NWX8_9PEZI|nr:SYF2 splicing factor-domain-containing protein [Pseudoneurospora amorphoporcata]